MNTPKGLSKLFPLTVSLLLPASAGPAETEAQTTAITSSTRTPIEFFNANSAGVAAFPQKPGGVTELVPTIKRLLGSGRAS
ncbi:MAG TPA: hypothetical protein VIP46_01890 [Pyrinomonadaceae bacterium]